MTPEYFIRRNAVEFATEILPNTEEENYPAANIINRLSYKWWRVVGATAFVDLTWAAAETLRELVVRFHTVRSPRDKFHNFGASDTIEIRLSNVAAGNNEIYGTGALPLVVDDHGYAHVKLPQNYAAAFARVTIAAPDLIAAGDLIEIEEMHFGVPWTPKQNPNIGSKTDHTDMTEFDIGEYSGAHIGEPKARYDEFERTWGVFTVAEAVEWDRFKRTHGTSRTFIFIASANEPLLKQPLVARFTKAPNRSDIGAGKFEVSATIVENR